MAAKTKTARAASKSRARGASLKSKVSKLPAVRGKKAVKAIPKAKAPRGIQLKLKRSQRETAFGAVIFMLDARMDMSESEREQVRKYKLGERIVYESSKRKKYQENAVAHADQSHDRTSMFAPAGQQARGIGKSLYRLTRAGISATAAALSLKITINSLLKGVHVECKSMGELLEAEEAIREAASNVKSYLGAARSFNKREELVEF